MFSISKILAIAATWMIMSGPAWAIIGGTKSPDCPSPNATVQVNGASGTLITPDLVVTAGHVVKNISIPSVAQPYSTTNGFDPAVWHAIPSSQSVNILIGAPAGRRADTTLCSAFTSPRTRLLLVDHNTTARLTNGDLIGLKSGHHSLMVIGGGNRGDLVENPGIDTWGSWEHLTIRKVSGATTGNEIRSFDHVALKAADGSYLSATEAGGFVKADSQTLAASEKFIIIKWGPWGTLSEGDFIHSGDLVGFVSTQREVGFIQVPYLATATQIAAPGYDDIRLLKLATPVPADVAIPMRLKLRPGPSESVDGFYRSADLMVAGYGLVEGRNPTKRREKAEVGSARRFVISRYTAGGSGRAGTEPGDSGGSWFIRTPEGMELVGITQQTNDNFISPMVRGGVDPEGHSKPDLHAWFSMFLRDDDCVATSSEQGIIRSAGENIGASTVCRFGANGAPFAVAYPDATRRGVSEICRPFDAGNLILQRPEPLETPGSEHKWTLSERQGSTITHRLLQIEGSWQQSYTRGAYLIRYLQRTGMNAECSKGSFVYFRRRRVVEVLSP